MHHASLKDSAMSHRKSIILLAIITAAVFINSLFNGFVWDDTSCILLDNAIRQFNIADLLFKKANGIEYIPLHSLSLAIDHFVWGFKPFGFHLTNTLLFLATVIMLYAALVVVPMEFPHKTRIAFWSALIFAVHPLHAEPVNFISNRCHLLALLAVVCSVYCLLRWLGNQQPSNLFLALGWYAAALLAKQSAITLPLFIPFIFIGCNTPLVTLKRKLAAFTGFSVITVLALLLHLYNALASSAIVASQFALTPTIALNKLVKAIHVYAFYLAKFIYPANLSVSYDDRYLKSGITSLLLVSATAVAIMAFCMLYQRKRHALLAAGCIWYTVFMLPALNFFDTAPTVADRYALIPSVGLALCAGYLANRLLLWYPPSRFILILLSVLLAFLTITRNLDWKSDYTLFRDAVEKNRFADRRNLADALWKEKKYSEALTTLKEEMELTGSYNYYFFLGRFYQLQHRYHEAIEAYQRALKQNGDAYKETHLALATAYALTGNNEAALEEYLNVLGSYSMDPHGLMNAEAEKNIRILRTPYLEKIKELQQYHPQLKSEQVRQLGEIGLLYQKIGMYDEAIASYSQLLERDPDNWIAWNNRGLSYSQKGNVADAVRDFETSFRINPKNTAALNTIGTLLVQTKDYERAKIYYRKAIAANPSDIYPLLNIARLYLLTGHRLEGRQYLDRAIAVSGNNEEVKNRARIYLDIY